MMMSVLVGLLFGMLLAQRFKVLVLVPAIMVSIVLTVSMGLGRGEPPLRVLTATVFVIIALQVGYVIGMALHHFMVLARASRVHSRSIPNVLQQRREAH